MLGVFWGAGSFAVVLSLPRVCGLPVRKAEAHVPLVVVLHFDSEETARSRRLLPVCFLFSTQDKCILEIFFKNILKEYVAQRMHMYSFYLFLLRYSFM